MGTIGKGDHPTYRDLSREIQAALRQLQDQKRRKRHFVQAVLEHAAGQGGARSMRFQMHLDTLPKTSLKMDGWKTSFLLGWPTFRGYVSFTECTLQYILYIFECSCISLDRYLSFKSLFICWFLDDPLQKHAWSPNHQPPTFCRMNLPLQERDPSLKHLSCRKTEKRKFFLQSTSES